MFHSLGHSPAVDRALQSSQGMLARERSRRYHPSMPAKSGTAHVSGCTFTSNSATFKGSGLFNVGTVMVSGNP